MSKNAIKIKIHMFRVRPIPPVLCWEKWERVGLGRYGRLEHSPLSISEAARCLKDLAELVMTSLEKLHDLGIAHNDIRLPNVSFNENFEAVLIDMDMCTSIYEPVKTKALVCIIL